MDVPVRSSRIRRHRVAQHPFALNDHADFVLRSSDNVDFYTIRAVLCASSPVFDDMFSFPPAVPNPDTDLVVNGRQAVRLTEHSSIVTHLLVMCTLKTFDSFLPTDINHLVNLRTVMDKYQLDVETAKFDIALERFVEKDPHRVFFIAFLWGSEDLMRKAAFATLRKPAFSPYLTHTAPELNLVPAMQMQLLLTYRHDCISYLQRTICETTSWIYGYADGPPPDFLATMGFEPVWTTQEGHSEDCGAYQEFIDGPDFYRGEGATWAQIHLGNISEMLGRDEHRRDPLDVIKSRLGVLETNAIKEMAKCPKCVAEGPDHLQRLSGKLDTRLLIGLQEYRPSSDFYHDYFFP